MQQNGGILADGVEQHGLAELRRRLSEDVNGFGLEEIQMRGMYCHVKSDCLRLAAKKGPLTPALSREGRGSSGVPVEKAFPSPLAGEGQG